MFFFERRGHHYRDISNQGWTSAAGLSRSFLCLRSRDSGVLDISYEPRANFFFFSGMLKRNVYRS